MTRAHENPLFTVDIPEKGASKGHTRIDMKSSSTPDVLLGTLCASLHASILFERLQAQGTNIIIDLGRNHARFDVLARYENDGINLQWTPRPQDQAQLSLTAERISNKTFMIGKGEKKAGNAGTQQSPGSDIPVPTPDAKHSAQPMPAAPQSKHDEPLSEAEENYLVKQLHRIP
jgi:hypothetical protein